MNNDNRRLRPVLAAMEIRSQYGIRNEEAIDLYQVMDNLNIRYREARMEKGILGACKAFGLQRLIVVSPDIGYSARKNFTIAHEIGHLMMHQGKHNCDEDMLNERQAKNRIEIEANEFASELILPRKIVRDELRIAEPTIMLAERLQKKYNSSLTSTLISMVKNTDDETALIYHDGKNIEWKICSDELKLQIETYVPESVVVQQAKYERKPVTGIVDTEEWFKGTNIETYICQENTIYFPVLNRFATILNLQLND